MTLSKKDKFLLVLLLIVALLGGYYYFIILPTEAKILTLKDDIALKELKKTEIEIKLASESKTDLAITNLGEAIVSESETYYTKMTQEELIMIVNQLTEGLPLEIKSLNILDSSEHHENRIRYTADVAFESDYMTLLDHLRNIQNNVKKLHVRDVSLQSLADGSVAGRYQLEFNAFPELADFTKPTKDFVGYKLNLRDSLEGPFNPYEGYVITVPEPDIIFPEYPEDKTPIDYETYRPKTQIYGFEDGSSFFVANLPEIKGDLSRSQTKVAGGYSADLSFDFIKGRPYSEANIVFDGNGVILSRQAEYLGLWMYAFEASTHKVGVVIVDSAGKAYKIELAPQVNWTQWKELEVKLPLDITYPCAIQRIYVEGVGYDQKLTGRYLFDQLQVSYPVQ